MSRSLLRISQYTIFAFGLLVFIYGLLAKNYNVIYFSCALFIISNMLFSIIDIRKRIVFLVFQLTFGLFLVIKPLISIWDETVIINFSDNIRFETSIILSVSLISFSILTLLPLFSLSKNMNELKYTGKNKLISIRFVSKILFYVTLTAYVIVIIEKIIFSQTHTIFEYYEGFTSQLPRLLRELADANLIIFYLFLATFPSKKESRLIIFLHIFVSFLTIGYGVRNVLVLNMLTLLIYFVLRNLIEMSANYWIKRRDFYLIVLFTPIGMILLQFLDNLRRNNTASTSNILTDFLLSQGISYNTVALSRFHSDRIPLQNIPYSLGSIYNYITQNIVSRFIFGTEAILQNTVEMALSGHSFGSALAYIDFPTTYLSGVGMGSSFVAELYYDFSIVGLFIGSVMLGIIMLSLPKLIMKNAYFFAVGLILIRWIIYIPRDTVSNWLVQGFSILNLVVLIAIMFISNLIHRRYYE
jgi:oligosaccharide repeat unit polymerase